MGNTHWTKPYPGEKPETHKKRVSHKFCDMPEAYHLHRFRWNIMGHLTFKNERRPDRFRFDAFYAALRKVCKLYELRFPKLQFFLKEEKGSRKDLPSHFHFLIAGLPKHIDLQEFSETFKSIWTERGGGLSEVSRYDYHLDGAGYLAKCFTSDSEDVSSGPTLSDAAISFLKRATKRERGI